ncbi:MAG: cytidine deaminase [Leptolinea sp.]
MLDQAIKLSLIKQAAEARLLAYAPYSHYPVGAAVLSASGKVYTGVNIENAAYPTGICAERVAIFKGVSEGEKIFTAVAVVTANGGTPCGSCRQVLSEFSKDMLVIIGDSAGNYLRETTLSALLPEAFGPGHLE